MEKTETMTETAKTALLQELVSRLTDRFTERMMDAICEETEFLLDAYNVKDDDGELLYEIAGRVFIGFQ